MLMLLLVLSWLMRGGSLQVIGIIALLQVPTVPSVSEDAGWPGWRGPSHDGTSREADLIDSWPATGPRVLWTSELGQGYSGFAVVGDRLYTQTQSLTEQSVVCLNADTGAPIWSYRAGWPSEPNGLYPGPKATPTWSDGRVYFASPDGTVGCLNAENGGLVWSVNPKRQYHGRGTDFGCSCSPLVVDNKVIVPVGGPSASVVALDANSGSTLWVSGDAPASYCTPVPIVLRGRRQVLTFLENTLAAFDLEQGTRVWNVEFSQGYDEHAAAPLYREPFVLVASPFRSGSQLLKIEDVNANSDQKSITVEDSLKVKTVWENPQFSNDVMSSVLVGNEVYGFDLKDAQSRLNRPSRGEFRCLDYLTGKIRWSTDQVGQANIIVADGKLILFNDRGELILAKASPLEYRELSRATIFEGDVCWTPPAFHRGRLYLRHHHRVVCLYLGKKPLDTLQPVQTLKAIPRIWRFDEDLLLSGEREFPATTPEWDELWNWYFWSALAILVVFVSRAGFVLTGRGLQALLNRLRNRAVAVQRETEVELGAMSRVADSPSSFDRQRLLPWGILFLLGLVGSSFLNRWLNYYVFSWPVSLWTGLQCTLMSISWAERQQDRRRARVYSRLAGCLLIGISAGYYWICRRLGLSIEWGFLIGFLPAFPISAWCSIYLIRPSRFTMLLEPLYALISFTAYFWACGVFLKWWLVVGS